MTVGCFPYISFASEAFIHIVWKIYSPVFGPAGVLDGDISPARVNASLNTEFSPDRMAVTEPLISGRPAAL